MLRTEEMLLNVGPQHPSTHGVLRLVIKIDGEIIRHVEPVIGYLHRGTEKLAEDLNYTQIIPYTDRMDYVCAMTNNYAIVHAKVAVCCFTSSSASTRPCSAFCIWPSM